MPRDNHPRERQARKLARKQGKTAPYDRILIVCEGSKTEPHYFEEIRQDLRAPTANICILPSQLGTNPLQVVKYAKQLFEKGDSLQNVHPRAFEKVYAVFDRDEHRNYYDALSYAATLDGKLKNDDRKKIPFQAIASVPNFELWLLLHFEDIRHTLHRDEVIDHLKSYLVGYEKGRGGYFARTKHLLPTALGRASQLALTNTAYDGAAPYTDVGKLVDLLTELKK